MHALSRIVYLWIWNKVPWLTTITLHKYAEVRGFGVMQLRSKQIHELNNLHCIIYRIKIKFNEQMLLKIKTTTRFMPLLQTHSSCTFHGDKQEILSITVNRIEVVGTWEDQSTSMPLWRIPSIEFRCGGLPFGGFGPYGTASRAVWLAALFRIFLPFLYLYSMGTI